MSCPEEVEDLRREWRARSEEDEALAQRCVHSLDACASATPLQLVRALMHRATHKGGTMLDLCEKEELDLWTPETSARLQVMMETMIVGRPFMSAKDSYDEHFEYTIHPVAFRCIRPTLRNPDCIQFEVTELCSESSSVHLTTRVSGIGRVPMTRKDFEAPKRGDPEVDDVFQEVDVDEQFKSFRKDAFLRATPCAQATAGLLHVMGSVFGSASPKDPSMYVVISEKGLPTDVCLAPILWGTCTPTWDATIKWCWT
jgi:hypothetical protein